MAKTKLEIIVDAKDNASGVLARIGGGLSSLGGLAMGAAVGGLAALAGGLAAIGTVGLSFNSQIEQVTARLNAFTKDGAETARILEQIKEEAAKTPFEFQEMANATANLMSSAKQAKIPLMDLIKTSEILAASNPAQGLEGAAFSLKEALSGDFVSIVERFNLPRQRLKELKEEGVPAMEAISIAMKEMGLDSDLVANMAETAAGRWSTLKDTFINMAGVITQPIFDTFSTGLGQLNTWFTENKEMVTGFANTVAGGISDVIGIISTLASGNTKLALHDFQHALLNLGVAPEKVEGITGFINSVQSEVGRLQGLFATFQAGGLFGSRSGSFGSEGLLNAMGIPPGIIDTIQTTFDGIAAVYTGFLTGGIFGKEILTPAGTAETGGMLRAMGLTDKEVDSVRNSIDGVVRDAERIGEAFGKIFAAGTGENAESVNALVQILESIAFVMERIAAAGDVAAQIRAISDALGGFGGATNEIIKEGTGIDVAGVNAFANSPQMDPNRFANWLGMGPAAQNAGPQSFGSVLGATGSSSIDIPALVSALVSAFQSAPPPVVNVSATLNGKEIAQDVSATLGSQAQSLARQGGFNAR